MPGYEVEIVVHVTIEVEADSKEEAIEQGWLWEHYAHNSEISSIHIVGDEIPD
jgi:hypothetical protein